MTTFLKSKCWASNSYSTATSHPPEELGWGHTVTVNGTLLSSLPDNLHLNTPNPWPTGKDLEESFKAIILSPEGLNLATLGCCLNCTSVKSWGVNVNLIFESDASETLRSRSPLSSSDWIPPSRSKEIDNCSFMVMWILSQISILNELQNKNGQGRKRYLRFLFNFI